MRRALLLLAACGGHPDRPPGPAGPAGTDTSPGHDVVGLLRTRCAPCHVDSPAPLGGFSADSAASMVGVVDPETGLAYVEPFEPDQSYVWLKLTDRQATVAGGDGTRMPEAAALAAADLDRVEAWILAGAPSEPGTTVVEPRCDPVADACTADCPAAPASLTHAEWHDRLTTSPLLTWEPVAGAVRYEVAVGAAAAGDDVACWTDVGTATAHTFTALSARDGETYVPSVRAFQADDRVSAATTSAGWRVDIQPPEVPTALDDRRAPVDGFVSWTHPRTDDASGFLGFELAVGTAPYGDDVTPWGPVPGAEPEATLLSALDPERWYWVSVRAVDVAGNASQPTTSEGFITCPEGYAFVPGDPDLGTTPFCVARYEMRIAGEADGAQGFDPTFVAESRAAGTPWTSMDKGSARVACDALGFSYQLIVNPQWQAIARSIERTPANWSGGAVGDGLLPRGHCDEDPHAPLPSDAGPCGGTNNPACEDPGHADWAQNRTHLLENGEVVWDLAGNVREQVDGSAGAPDGLWMSFDAPAFTVDPGWLDYRLAFAPDGPYTEAHGVGRIYGGSGNLTRGGSFDPDSSGAGGSDHDGDVGVFAAHHNTWSTGGTEGFRCVFVPM